MDLDDDELKATRMLNGTDKIWITKNGEKIAVKDMSTQHILNCIKAIKEEKIIFVTNTGYAPDNDYIEYEENDLGRERWIKTFENELKKRGVLDE